MAASLHQIRDLGLLTADFLSVLPNPQDPIPLRYQDIRAAIVAEMNNQPLTPTHAKSHAPAKYLIQGKASLKELLSQKDIELLVDFDDEPPEWAISASQRNSDADRFLAGLSITEWDIDKFVEMLARRASDGMRRISEPPYYVAGPDDEFMGWLAGKPVDWCQRFYALLYADYLSAAGWKLEDYRNELKPLRIIRLSDASLGVGTECFFPSDGIERDEVLPRVDAGVYTSGKSKPQQENAKRFLEAVGVRLVGEAEQVEAILKQRYTRSHLKPKPEDLKRFVALVEKEPAMAHLFGDYHIFERKDGKWGKPSQVYLDLPFMDTGLHAYYDALGDTTGHNALAEKYKDCGVAVKSLVKFAKGVGVQTRLEIKETSCSSNPEWSYLRSVDGERYTSPINRDYLIEGLERLFAHPSLVISKLIWQTMCSLPLHPNCLRATYQKNETWGGHSADSQLIHQLRAASWIPQGDGVFVRPAESSRELLPEGFPFDPGWPWLKALHFGDEATKASETYRQKQAVAKELGFESAEEVDKWKKVKDTGVSPDELLAKYAQCQPPSQPEESVRDPERRRKNIQLNMADAPSKESVVRERSIQKGISDITAQAKAYLRVKNKNPEGQLICQCCHEEMPFKLPSGEHYFEAVQCIRDKETRYFQNRLALCPTCAAMYQHACETEEGELRRRIVEHDADDQTSAVEIPIRLAGHERTLRFVGTHWFDLKTVLKEE